MLQRPLLRELLPRKIWTRCNVFSDTTKQETSECVKGAEHLLFGKKHKMSEGVEGKNCLSSSCGKGQRECGCNVS